MIEVRFVIAFLLIPAAAFADLMAGTAKADVTPPIGGAMYGYGARGANVSEGVHDPLYAKALVLSDGSTRLAVVTMDLGSFPQENTDRVRAQVREETGIEHVLLVASHTHSSPRFEEDFPSAADPYVREMEAKVANAIAEANENLQPARVGVGWGEVAEGHNRRMITTNGEVIMFWGNRERRPTSPVDYSLAILRVESPDGEPIANLVNYACHPVVLGPENLEISADYVGYMLDAIEKELGGQAMFLQGAAGDINPFWDKTPPTEGGFAQAEKMGLTIAEVSVRVSRGIDAFHRAPSISVHTEVIPLASRTDRAREERDIPAELTTVLIGEAIALATFPGEFFVEHGLALKKRSRIEHTLFVGYTNGAWAYFPTIQATTEGGYGAASATRVEVGAGERLVNRALVNLYYQADLIHP